VAGNTPFRRWKREVHEGGVADPLVVSFPPRIPDHGAVRTQYVHAVDLAPTVLDLLGFDPPDVLHGVEQQPVAGASIVPSLADADAPDPRTTQYYEMFGCQAIRHGNWKAVTYHPIHVTEPGLDQIAWELYDLDTDPSECHDLAESNPAKVAELVELWWEQARIHQVLPLDNRPFSEFTLERPHAPSAERTTVTYYPGSAMVPEEAVPPLFDREHRITAHVDVPSGGSEGVLLSLGNLLGGFSFFVQNRQLSYVHNLVSREITRIDSQEAAVPEGSHALAMSYTPAGGGGGRVAFLVDGEPVGDGIVETFTPIRWNLVGAGLVCGSDPNLPVCDDYAAPFAFTGTLDRVVLEVAGDAPLDPKAAADIALARQ
jgi:arylsulfatase